MLSVTDQLIPRATDGVSMVRDEQRAWLEFPDGTRSEVPGEVVALLALCDGRRNRAEVTRAMLELSDRVSDLNFSVGRPPQVELDGDLHAVRFAGLDALSPYQTEQIAMQLMQGNRDSIHTLVNTGSVDCSYAIPGKSRFRVNIFQQRGTHSIVMRVINTEIPTVEELGLPAEVNNMTL